jgi:hypothetical protein
MKKLLITLLLIASSALQAQQWTPVAKDVEGTVSSLDWSTLRKEGNLRRIWSMDNYSEKKPSMLLSDSTGIFSSRFRTEFDCKNERQRTLSYTAFSEKDLGGKNMQQNDSPGFFVDVAPGTVAWKLMEEVCKAK